MKFTALATFMGFSGSISGNRSVQWLQIPHGQDEGSYSSILGLHTIGQRQLRISSTVKRESQAVASGEGQSHASVRAV